MVSLSAILFLGISAVACLTFPLLVLLYFNKKDRVSLKPVIAGMVVFLVFTQILEKLLHMVVIGGRLITDPIVLTIYGALAAGIFEEVGRFLAFKTVLKQKQEWIDGLAYGIGHGGLEAILFGTMAYGQYLLYSILINNGTFDTMLNTNLTGAQVEQLNLIKGMLVQFTAGSVMLGVVERIFAFGIQVALTMVVLYAVKYRKFQYLLLAILLHALIDVPAALYQTGIVTSIYMVEGIVAIFFIIALIYLVKSKKFFQK